MPADDRSLQAGLLSRLSATVRRSASRGRRGRVETRPPTAQSRRVVIKARYVKLTHHGAASASRHLKYIQRDGVERDGSPGVLYGPSGEVPAATFEQPRLGEEHQFRFIIAPEDAGELDLTAYVRSLMARVERDVRRPLEWAAVNHYNTEHPHAHVVVRGVDRRGKEVRFDREYIARGMRERAQELATQELGPRGPDDLRREREREVTQERFTALDRTIERRCKEGRVHRADLETSRPASRSATPLVARLAQLERMRLAERVGPDAWELVPTWKEQLRALGERGDIIKQMHAAVRGDPARYHDLRPGQPLPGAQEGVPSQLVYGRVRAKALADEMRGTLCAIVETTEGAAIRVPLDARAAEACRVGDFVALRSVPRPRGRPEDLAVEAMAREAGGRCVPPDMPSGDAPDVARRLRQLQALGLATPDGAGAWRVTIPLSEALARLDRDRPDHRLLLRTEARSLEQQIAARAPVWLDRLDRSVLAPHGLGAEMRVALERRAEALRSFGVQPDDPRRIAKLGDLERRVLGGRAAAEAGVEFVSKTPEGFRGRLAQAPESTGYAVVSDGVRLVAVPMTRELNAQLGRVVTLVRDSTSGKMRARPADLDRGG